ncbi:phospholipase D-like domain-containing protein [Actinosynnema mirum]|uniref:Phospholipase D n=1 Tax=Actinosynnema mirum (strain ATCC 29888 / DSM 43827 / JCM 3225 / NBRC 14064 / NCIMB 13271 / NRRL B-12336 / IMRU 3971 / 101) TaxID=446462 RepID=C6WNN1_ACTMD|nr:phospholipase D family protein [Actinosynnema mirum]ACU34950.1 Phospholipase D [Actinosynnema mirum DSM 43827]
MGLLDVLDERLGDGLERAVLAHHRRRLGKLGWASVLGGDAGSWSPHRQVRDGNLVRVLIDGREGLPEIDAAIRAARSHVHIANWHASADFRLTREPGSPPLRDLLADVAERVDVRMLVWGGPPVPLFEPTRKRTRRSTAEFERDSRVRCLLDTRERTLHCHHEKIVVVDDEVAFVGGLDFTALDGDRHDTTDHPPREPVGWHDLAARIEGPAVADVAEHFRQRWQEIAREELPEPRVPAAKGGASVQIARTVPERTYDFAPRGDFSLADAYLRGLRSAERLVYLENQFLWSPEVVEILIDKLRTPPDPRFRVVLVLPRKPSNGADTTRGQLGRLLDADDGNGRLVAATLAAHDGSPVYVHAKLAIVDDRWLTLGSANLNEHSLFNDTEVNLVTDDPDLARDTRLRLWAEHLGLAESEVDGPPDEVVDRLWRAALDHDAGRAGEHRAVRLPGVSRRSERLQGPLRGLLVDG